MPCVCRVPGPGCAAGRDGMSPELLGTRLHLLGNLSVSVQVRLQAAWAWEQEWTICGGRAVLEPAPGRGEEALTAAHTALSVPLWLPAA